MPRAFEHPHLWLHWNYAQSPTRVEANLELVKTLHNRGQAAAQIGHESHRTQDGGNCPEALFPAGPRGFPLSSAKGDAEAADERPEIAKR